MDDDSFLSDFLFGLFCFILLGAIFAFIIWAGGQNKLDKNLKIINIEKIERKK